MEGGGQRSYVFFLVTLRAHSENNKNRGGGLLTDGQTEDDAQTPSYGELEGSDC